MGYTCAGGITTAMDQNNAGKVLAGNGSAIEGLYAAGEVANASYKDLWSISGIPLLHCIYSGRMAGAAAAKEVLKGKEAPRQDLKQLILSTLNKKEEEKEEKEEKGEKEQGKDEKPLEDMSKEELVELCKKLKESGP